DNGTTQTGTSIAVTGEGVHTIKYRSTDNAGNVQADKTATVQIDPTKPSTTDNAPGTLIWKNAPVTVTLTPADLGGSGVKSTTYELDNGSTQTGTSIAVTGEGV